MKESRTTKFLVLLFVISILISMSGCLFPYKRDKVVMITQVYHAIPYAEGDLHMLKCEVIETDDYGRILFAFQCAWARGFAIQQKYDEKYVYYYDNISFMVSKNKYKEYEPEDLDALKVSNDWNQEIDEDKMIKRALLKSTLLRNRESMFLQEKVEEAFSTNYPITENIDNTAIFFDYNQTGQEIFYIAREQHISKTDEQEGEWELLGEYLMILNADGTFDPKNYVLEIDDRSNINALLAEIKERNGWVE